MKTSIMEMLQLLVEQILTIIEIINPVFDI